MATTGSVGAVRPARTVEGIKQQHGVFTEPPVVRWLFSDTRSAWIWLVLRVWLGWRWLEAGLGKVGNPAWTGDQAGAAVAGFLKGALAKTAGEHPDVPAWYAWFIERVALPHAPLFGHLVAYGEVLIGVALILGLFTGIAAFAGSFMNANFLFAGTVSSNPVMFIVATWLVLAWRVAGWYGADRWVLPALGTPWQPGAVFAGRRR
ncbi:MULTISPECIES: DoxX family protein [Thermaerobacter]|uniref:DoxX family membrane protein n=1 Tax=Thermaerobacter composti TaxID=554949 RepID=A0ABZ0QQU5_9FIRM|nr:MULTISPECIES: DoxX family membrane protein [Thermaerobacter]WPD19776.1 DoxX family membrane protein [Thermaerobacter composti]